MNINENALKVLEKRYLKDGESPTDMICRVADAVSTTSDEYNDFCNIMYDLDFLPNSPTLMNAGKPLGQLSACFVLPVQDTMEGIFETMKNAALIFRSGGGVGYSFSRLRPKGALIKSTGGTSSGPVSFMQVFNSMTESVKQGGTRRGASMGLLKVTHPDILEFIKCKTDNNQLNNFNISVGITEEFIEAVKIGSDYDLIDPHSKEVVGKLKAKEVFDLLVDQAWKNGEPGIVFLDRINADNPTPELGEIESTNP